MGTVNQPSTSALSGLVGAHKYPQLFSPLRLGRITVQNRLVVPALTTNFAEADGTAGDRIIAYLSARARGGYGLVVTENIGVHPSGRVMPRMLMASDDSFLPGLTALAKSVKENGCVLFGQLSHAGRQTKSSITGMPLVAASAVACPLNREVPQALSVSEINLMEKAFIEAACRLAKAGFDGIEIHGAHGYLVGGFLSNYSNKRTDAYGGSLENRMRFLLNIVRGIKQALGDDFPISVRISAREFVPDGLDLPEAVAIGHALHAAGIHALSVSVGVYESFNRLSMITGEPEGQWLSLAAALREQLAPLPIIGVGRIKRPEVAEKALAMGQIDLAALGRASIADPDLPNKVFNGNEDSIAWCVACNVCLGRSSRPETICPVNPQVGREFALNNQVATKPKSIRIVGTSVSAFTAADLAARRGHLVTIDPAGEPIGGMQAWRAAVPGQEEFLEAIRSAERRALEAGAKYSSDYPDPDTIIWRVRRYQPQDTARTYPHPVIVSVYDYLASPNHRFDSNANICVIGSDLASAEVAIRLAREQHHVRLFVPARDVASDAHPGYREVCRRLLASENVEVFLGSSGPDAMIYSWATALVIGHPVTEVVNHDSNSWKMPQTIAQAYGTPRVDAYIADAYEPGAMTKGVYEVFNIKEIYSST